MAQLPFENRSDAGRRLGARLATRTLAADPIVVALPRGGVPVGAEIAEILNAPLDVLVVRKLGVPWQTELAMGAMVGGTRLLDSQIIAELGISSEQIEDVAAEETREMRRREKLYRGSLPAADLRGHSVVLVDDGLATGSTMLAAARHVRAVEPRELIIAVPVSSAEAYRRLRGEADDCISLVCPDTFIAVGYWYRDFRQVSDADVQRLLTRK